jgi:hypothetical protein
MYIVGSQYGFHEQVSTGDIVGFTRYLGPYSDEVLQIGTIAYQPVGGMHTVHDGREYINTYRIFKTTCTTIPIVTHQDSGDNKDLCSKKALSPVS